MQRPPFGAGQGSGSVLARGIAARRSGQLAEAEKLFVAATKLEPQRADAHFLLAATRVQRGRPRDALKPIRRAIDLDDRHPDYQRLHGSIRIALGEHARAKEPLRRAIRLAPGEPEGPFLLGVALGGLGDHAGAAAGARRSIELDPRHAAAWSNLGAMQIHLGEPLDAIAACERATELDPGHMLAWMNLGRALCEVGRHERALDCCERALRLAPGNAAVLTNLGQALRELGRTADAAAAYRRALDAAPDMTRTRLMLAAIHRHTPGDGDVARIEAIARDPMAHGVDEHDALFTWAKVLDDLGDDRAFDVLLRANAARRRTYAYSVADDAERFARIRAAFPADVVARLADVGCPDPTPIFVVGMPRSGTTLVEQILASHPDVAGAGELETLGDLLDAPPFGADYPDGVAELDAAELRAAGARYVERVRARAGAEPAFVVDKMPRNFVHLGAIRALLPSARIVHCVRDARDTCLSNFEQNYKATLPFAFDLAELGRYHRLHDELMAHWHAVLGPDAIVEVRYEELVTDLEPNVRRLLERLGLPWSAACLAFHENVRPVLTASLEQVRRPAFATSIGRWRRHADRLGPLLDALEGEVVA